MATFVLTAELHLRFYVPVDLTAAQHRTVSRVLTGRKFQAALGKSTRRLCGGYASLTRTKVRIAA